MITNTAMLFPGQGSQFLGMLAPQGHEIEVRETFEEASNTLGLNVWDLVQQGPLSRLNSTMHTQPALLTAGIALYRLWRARGGTNPRYMAGHSLGEYTALVASGALQFSDACLLTAKRGEYMQQAVPVGAGAMAAIIGLPDETVVSICKQASEGEIVEAANFNAIGQVVISGNKNAVRRAMMLAEASGARLCTELAVSVPSHCQLMKPAAAELETALRHIAISAPEIPVIHNVDLSYHSAPEAIRERLVAQLYSPVRWVETIFLMNQLGVSLYLECGPGRVLTGLNKRIDKSFVSYPLEDKESFEMALAASE